MSKQVLIFVTALLLPASFLSGQDADLQTVADFWELRGSLAVTRLNSLIPELQALQKVSSDKDTIILNQFARKNLDSWGKAEDAFTLEEVLKDKARKRQKTSTGGITPQLLSTLTTDDPDWLPDREFKGRKIHTREEAAKKAGIFGGSATIRL